MPQGSAKGAQGPQSSPRCMQKPHTSEYPLYIFMASKCGATSPRTTGLSSFDVTHNSAVSALPLRNAWTYPPIFQM